MSKWCSVCYKNEIIGKWEACSENCPVFGKSFDDLARTVIEREINIKQNIVVAKKKIIERIK